jgi:hypothetical protein
MSQGQAIRSVFGRARVTHFMLTSYEMAITPPALS